MNSKLGLICCMVSLTTGLFLGNTFGAGSLKSQKDASRALIYSSEKRADKTAEEILQSSKGRYKEIYSPSWDSLKKYPIPEWFKNGKFGIYLHWGPYAVPAWKTEWYPHGMYMKDGFRDKDFYGYHLENYGNPSEFGYKDFIPEFTGERFDAEDWAELFRNSGATFAGPCAEHHDGFAMWDSDLTKWDSTDMGPMRDVTGELEEAIKERGMKFVVSFHHARNWFYYTREAGYDTADPRFSYLSSIYGPIHGDGNPDAAYLEDWEARVIEVIDKYDPDLLWFDGAFGKRCYDPYKRDMMAYYYNKALAEGDEVGVTHKHDLPEGAGIVDHERGSAADIEETPWLTDNSVYDNSWGYIQDIKYASKDWLIDELIDVVSKNGSMLLNVGPDAHGVIPQTARERLLAMGDWLEVNGEAIYDTHPWKTFGEGPTHVRGGNHNRRNADFVGGDLRFTAKGANLYLIALATPENGKLVVKSLGKESDLLSETIDEITLLGSEIEIDWEWGSDALQIEFPAECPTKYAHAFKLVLEK